MRLYTSDPHFGHANIIEYCKRPFKTTEQMDAAIIGNINNSIKDPEKDELVIAGDFSLSKDYNTIAAYRNRINCKTVHLVRGNHDRLSSAEYAKLFSSVSELKRFQPKGYQKYEITVCHYAMRTWQHSHKGSWHVYGHSHGTLPDDPNSLSFDIGVDCFSFYPLSEQEIYHVLKGTKTQKL